MDIHINDLVFEEGYKDISLKDIPFREIDQEFIYVRSKNTFDTDKVNILYYCFIKPYLGQVFRVIGKADERTNKIYVDEDVNTIEDVPFSELENEKVSKIIENGDLISNQLIVNIPYEYYEGNDELKDLMKTRKESWIDSKRIKGNPDNVIVDINGNSNTLVLVKCLEEGILAKKEEDGEQFIIKSNLEISRV